MGYWNLKLIVSRDREKSNCLEIDQAIFLNNRQARNEKDPRSCPICFAFNKLNIHYVA